MALPEKDPKTVENAQTPMVENKGDEIVLSKKIIKLRLHKFLFGIFTFLGLITFIDAVSKPVFGFLGISGGMFSFLLPGLFYGFGIINMYNATRVMFYLDFVFKLWIVWVAIAAAEYYYLKKLKKN